MDPLKLKEIDNGIREIKSVAEDLKKIGADFPAVACNTARILASIKMLELNICDVPEGRFQ